MALVIGSSDKELAVPFTLGWGIPGALCRTIGLMTESSGHSDTVFTIEGDAVKCASTRGMGDE